MNDCFLLARQALQSSDADEKMSLTRAAARQMRSMPEVVYNALGTVPVTGVGRPARPRLVPGARVGRRGVGTAAGRAVMIHAIVHIEFNAINLALDAMQRFPGMPGQFYRDWMRVAEEEAYHFELLRAHLRHLGADYGDFDAHGSLWEMCERTADDVLHRMALVPRVLEARGLDVTPGIIEKLIQAGDGHAAGILGIILRDEVGHVETGNRWFRYCCEQRGLDAEQVFASLLQEYYPRGLFGPFNLAAREQAGFSRQEMLLLSHS